MRGRKEPGMGIEQKLGNMGVVTTTLEQVDQLVTHARLCADAVGLACCAIE